MPCRQPNASAIAYAACDSPHASRRSDCTYTARYWLQAAAAVRPADARAGRTSRRSPSGRTAEHVAREGVPWLELSSESPGIDPMSAKPTAPNRNDEASDCGLERVHQLRHTSPPVLSTRHPAAFKLSPAHADSRQ